MDGTELLSQAGAAGMTARCGVVDLGSNSVRLVVFEGRGRRVLRARALPRPESDGLVMK